MTRSSIVVIGSVATLTLLSGACRRVSAPRAGSETALAPSSVAPPKVEAGRPLSPLSGSVLRGTRPRFRWRGPPGSALELSQSPSFGKEVQRLRGDGDATPEQPLRQGLWFWRIAVTDHAPSPAVWHFTIASDVDRTVQSGVILGSDYDGDGLAEIGLRGALARVAQGRSPGVTITEWRLGDPVPAALRREANEPELQWDRPRWLGDIDGDGRAEASVYAMRRALMPDGRVPVRLLLKASPTGVGFIASQELPIAATALGDVNGDGYSDLGVCSPASERCDVRSGSAGGSYGTLAQLAPCASPTPADMDGDGFGDVWCRASDGSLTLYRGSAGGLSLSPAATLALKVPGASLLGSDVDGDGFGDLLVADPRTSSIWLVAGQRALSSVNASLLGKWSGAALQSPSDWTYLSAATGATGTLVALARSGAPSRSLGVYWVTQVSPQTFAFPGKFQSLTDQRAPLAEIESVGDVDGDGRGDALFTLVQDIDGTKEYRLWRGSSGKEPLLLLETPWKGADVAPFPTP